MAEIIEFCIEQLQIISEPVDKSLIVDNEETCIIDEYKSETIADSFEPIEQDETPSLDEKCEIEDEVYEDEKLLELIDKIVILTKELDPSMSINVRVECYQLIGHHILTAVKDLLKSTMIYNYVKEDIEQYIEVSSLMRKKFEITDDIIKRLKAERSANRTIYMRHFIDGYGTACVKDFPE